MQNLFCYRILTDVCVGVHVRVLLLYANLLDRRALQVTKLWVKKEEN